MLEEFHRFDDDVASIETCVANADRRKVKAFRRGAMKGEMPLEAKESSAKRKDKENASINPLYEYYYPLDVLL